MKANPSSQNFVRLSAMCVVYAYLGATVNLAHAEDKVPLALEYPAPTLKGTPEDLPKNPLIDPIPDKPPVIMVPKSAVNVAKGKPVTSSINPFSGDLKQITDGQKEAIDSDSVEFKKGVQWIQVDLGKDYTICAIAMWHDHRYVQVMHGVIVQISDDPDFKTNVVTVFNNDRENTAGFGAGKNKEYFETFQGKVVEVNNVKGRYVRGYTHGSSQGALNAWQELEVYALPAE